MLTPKQQKEIADAFGFSNFEAFKTYVEKAMSLGMSYDEVIKELETTPRIGPQRGKFVPIPNKVLDAALMPDITGGIAPPERKQWGEAELARLQRKATGEELSGMEKVQAAYSIFENLLTMAAGARGAKKLGTQKGRMAFHTGKKPTALRKAAELSVASKKLVEGSEELPSAKILKALEARGATSMVPVKLQDIFPNLKGKPIGEQNARKFLYNIYYPKKAAENLGIEWKPGQATTSEMNKEMERLVEQDKTASEKPSVASKKPLGIGTGPKLRELPPGVESNVPFGPNTTIYNKIQKLVSGQQVEIAPIEILKHYYQETRNLPDQEAAQILGEKINRFRKGNEQIRIADLFIPIPVKQKRYFVQGMHGEYKPGKGEIIINSAKPIRDRVETLLHELTHVYDTQKIVRSFRKTEQTINELPTNPQKLLDIVQDPYFNPALPFEQNIQLLTQPKSKLQQTKVVRGYPGDFQKYALSSLEVGPNLWGPARRYAERMGYSLQTRRDIPEFIRQLREDPAKKQSFFQFLNKERGLDILPQNQEKRQRYIQLLERSNEQLLDRMEFDKKIQLEWLKWVKAPEQKETEVA